ncbi:unnamed protein product, partial [Didymodactylos carnosus]
MSTPIGTTGKNDIQFSTDQ